MAYHPLTQRIQQLLTDHHCWFETFEHQPVLTSEDAAKLRHGYTLDQGAKALLLRIKKTGGEKFFTMVVIPGSAKFDGSKVKALFAAKDIRFATPEEVSAITDGVVPGGVPPFGNLFGLSVTVDPTLLKQEKMVFNAGDRSFSIAMKTADYQKVVAPTIASVV